MLKIDSAFDFLCADDKDARVIEPKQQSPVGKAGKVGKARGGHEDAPEWSRGAGAAAQGSAGAMAPEGPQPDPAGLAGDGVHAALPDPPQVRIGGGGGLPVPHPPAAHQEPGGARRLLLHLQH